MMDDHFKVMAQLVLSELNSLGIVKDAQVNSVTTRVVATALERYFDAQKIKLSYQEGQ